MLLHYNAELLHITVGNTRHNNLCKNTELKHITIGNTSLNTDSQCITIDNGFAVMQCQIIGLMMVAIIVIVLL